MAEQVAENERMLAFLTKLVKDRGLSVSEFIEQSGLNRSQFYACVKEPQKFDDDDLVQMTRVLKMSEDERKSLFAYKEITDPEYKQVIQKAKNIITADPYAYQHDGEYGFEYYEQGTNGSRKWSASALAMHMVDALADDEEEALHHSIHVTVFNCLSRSISFALSNLLAQMEEYIAQKNRHNSTSVRIAHYINRTFSECTLQKVDFLEIIMPYLSMVADYQYREALLERPIWSGQNDLCMIKYEKKTKKKEPRDKTETKNTGFFLLGFNRKEKCYVLALDQEQRHAYDFFSVDAKGLSFDRTTNNSSLNVNEAILKFTIARKKILYHHDLCFDNIDQIHWERVFSNISENTREAVADVLDPKNLYAGFSAAQKLSFGIDYIGRRFQENEKNGAVNIISAIGLAEFAHNGYIADFALEIPVEDGVLDLREKLQFDPSGVYSILEDVKNHIAGNKSSSAGQKYYLLRPKTVARPYSFCIFQDAAIWMTSPESRHALDSASFYEETDVVNAIFDYIMEEIVGKQDEPDSDLMQDDEAVGYVQALMDRIKEQHPEIEHPNDCDGE
jgi:hypothetical protein